MSVTQVQTSGISDDSVINSKIADNAVGTSQIADSSVTGSKLSPQVSVATNGLFLSNDGINLSWESLDISGRLINFRQVNSTSTSYTTASANSTLVILATVYRVSGSGFTVSLFRNGITIAQAATAFGVSGDGTIGTTSPLYAVEKPGAGTFTYSTTVANGSKIIILEFA